jgi:hypothetical protein
LQQQDEHLSNWFPIGGLPSQINRHLVTRDSIGKIEFDAATFRWPAASDSDISFLSFAEAGHFLGQLPPNHIIAATEQFSLQSILERTAPARLSGVADCDPPPSVGTSNARNRSIHPRTVEPCKELLFSIGTNSREPPLFPRRRRQKGLPRHRGLRHAIRAQRYWHYGINAKAVLHPVPHYVIKGHVLFSDDGLKLWDSKERLAKAHRNPCKNWWNDEWRDRMLAVMTYLADEQGRIPLPLSPSQGAALSVRPELFVSHVSYLDPDDIVKEEELDDYSFEDEEDGLEADDDSAGSDEASKDSPEENQ